MEKINGSIIVGYDFTNGEDKDVLIVGEKKGVEIDIINAFEGEEARELYLKLVTQVKKGE